MGDHLILTIGIPVYNAEKNLKLAIDSVLNQSYPHFELIISEDGSTDSSWQIIQSYSDSRIRILRDGMNKGIGYRLNEQIEHAKGKYFARMDGDDIMFPDRIQQQIDFLESNPEIDVIGGSAIVMDEDHQIMGLRKVKRDIQFEDAIVGSIFIHPTIMGKTAWFQKYQYDNGYSGTEDHELFMRSFKASKFHNLDTPVLFYRDTNQIRFKTYLHRQKELIWSFDKNQAIIQNPVMIFKLKCKIYMRSLIFIFLAITGLYSILLKKRNKPIDVNSIMEFEKILQSQLNKRL
jgi:glycosyltransferase involved in cell wall biosynthesis